jgi:hypothetical protein
MILSSIGIIASKAAAAPTDNIVTRGLQCKLEASIYSGSGNWLDQSGNGKNFTPYNGVSFVSDGINSYFLFDGTNDYFSGPASNSFNFANDHTIEFGVLNISGSGTILSFQNAGTGASGVGYGIHSSIPEGSSVLYDIRTDSGNDRANYTDNNLYGNLIGWQFRKGSSGQFRQIMKNTQALQQYNAPLSNNSDIPHVLNANPVLLGNNAGKSEYYRGRLYYFRVYNVKLTDAECLQNWNVDKIKLGIT